MSLEALRAMVISNEYEYHPRKPGALVAFLPGVSLPCQITYESHFNMVLDIKYPLNTHHAERLASHEFNKLSNMYTWHVLGSLTQSIVFVWLKKRHKAFLIPASVSLFEYFWSFKGLSTSYIIKNKHKLLP